jgi:hypothetical protein
MVDTINACRIFNYVTYRRTHTWEHLHCQGMTLNFETLSLNSLFKVDSELRTKKGLTMHVVTRLKIFHLPLCSLKKDK